MKDRWECISPRLIEESFKKCGVSNNPDGSEDDFIWHSDDDRMSCTYDDDNDESSTQ
jgi:hypothetical protein